MRQFIMKKWLVIIILAISQFVMILDSTVMNVSISTVAKDLGTTISGMQAAITFYALTMGQAECF
jgi:predicted MFS family arabinose efflux permease